MNVNRYSPGRALLMVLIAACGPATLARAAEDSFASTPIPGNLGNAVVKVFATEQLADAPDAKDGRSLNCESLLTSVPVVML